MVLFITDDVSALNGMSVFSNYFIHWLHEKYDDNIFVYEVRYNHIISTKTIDSNRIIKHIYVNGHFSKSDILIRNKQLDKIISEHNFKLCDEFSLTVISHGWQKVKCRLSIYSIIFNLKNTIKTLNIKSISKYYSSIIFISNKSDNYRHYDFKWSVKNNFKYEYLDLTNKISVNNSILSNAILNDYILIISNFDTVKNLLLLVKINFYKKIKGKKIKNFVLLTAKPKSFTNKIIYKLLIFSKVTIIFDQTQKKFLIANCNYLFIPSHTEYLPIVAFEAFSMNKSVLSFYFIIGLSECKKYHFIIK
jgi:hypothetical protein